MNTNFAAQIVARRDEALADFRATGSEIEDGLAHGYSLVLDRPIEGLPALAFSAQVVHRETGTNFSLGFALATSRAIQLLNEISKGA